MMVANGTQMNQDNKQLVPAQMMQTQQVQQLQQQQKMMGIQQMQQVPYQMLQSSQGQLLAPKPQMGMGSSPVLTNASLMYN